MEKEQNEIHEEKSIFYYISYIIGAIGVILMITGWVIGVGDGSIVMSGPGIVCYDSHSPCQYIMPSYNSSIFILIGIAVCSVAALLNHYTVKIKLV